MVNVIRWVWLATVWPLILVSSLAVGQSPQSQYIVMSVGEVRVMKVPDVEQIATGNESIINYKALESGEFMVIAIGEGRTNLQLWQKGGRRLEIWVTVNSANSSSDLRFAKTAVANIPGMKVREFEGKLIFEGIIDARFKDTAFGLMSYFKNSMNLLQVREFEVKPLIRMDVKIIDMSEDAVSRLGVNWSQSTTGPIYGVHKTFKHNNHYRLAMEDDNGTNEDILGIVPPDKGLYSYFGITASLGSTIDLMASNGDAVVIAAPKLSAKSGEVARFASGGEFPIPMINGLGGASVEFKAYGVLLEIQPTVDENGSINASVATELSMVDNATQVNGVPGVIMRSSETVVNLSHGDTLVISGLEQASASMQNSKVPILGDIPLLGRLFSSRSKDAKKNELIIMITPYIFDANSDINQELLNKEESVRRRFKGQKLIEDLLR